MLNHTSVRAFLIAIQFLTRIPIPDIRPPQPSDMSRAALYYPLVGLLIGTIMIAIAWLLSGREPQLIAALLLLSWAIITGALHLDGLADCADAWLGGFGSRKRTHAILKDPLIGTAGAAAMMLVILIKYSALSVLVEQHNYIIIMLAPILGRAFILLLFTSTDYVRKQGLASDVVRALNGRAALMGVLIVFLISAWISLPGMIATLLIFLGLRKIMIDRLSGCTGDTAGATVEITEASWLLTAALFY